jgi:hypothetical protein
MNYLQLLSNNVIHNKYFKYYSNIILNAKNRTSLDLQQINKEYVVENPVQHSIEIEE